MLKVMAMLEAFVYDPLINRRLLVEGMKLPEEDKMGSSVRIVYLLLRACMRACERV